MKRMILILMLMTTIFGTSQLFAQFGGGAGTQANPYQISTIVHLNNIRGASYLNKYYIQTQDINMSVTNPANVNVWVSGNSYNPGDYVKFTPGSVQYTYVCIQATNSINPTNTSYWTQMWESAKGWKPIGDSVEPFHGVYDGNSKYISNLYINRGASPVANNVYPTDGEDMVGLFGYVSNGSNTVGNNFDTVIKNVALLNPDVTGRRATGSLVGRVFLPYTLPARSYTAYIERSFATFSGGTATVRGLGAVGGLVGANNSDSKQRVPVVRYSWAYVTVSSTHPNNEARNPDDYTGTGSIYNPYNIKYGGLIGCNENGINYDSFARGNVSGGDRVGGLVGCTIGGAIFRSYSTGTVTRGIAPGDWQGGIGGLVGRTVGNLPPGLGGNNAVGSCEDCYWDTQTSGYPTSPGGTGKTTAQMKVQGTFNNWDFVNIWGIDAGINDGYPYLRGTASSEFYYRTKQSGNWNDVNTWQYSVDNVIWNNAIVTPDATNSLSITILNAHIATVTAHVIIDQTTINAGGQITINSGVDLDVTNGTGTDLTINGTLRITGMLVPEVSSSIVAGTGSKVIFDGSVAQTTNSYFPTTFYDVDISNPAGVNFANSITVSNVLSVYSGTYTGAQSVDGYYSPAVKYIEIDPSAALISNFSVTMNNAALMPYYVDRQWDISGTYTGNKVVTFYWTSADDNNFDWTGIEPAVFKGTSKYTGTYDVSGATRYITVSIPTSLTKGTYTIGAESEETLPVELSSFTATLSAYNYVLLQWVTQFETNVLGFRIYKARNPELMQAQMLNTLINGTNTSQTQVYAYADEEIFEEGTYYYWLENVDIGGSTQFFGPISIYVNLGGENPIPELPLVNAINKIYPNPFNPETAISFSVKETAQVQVAIYNARGQLVTKLFQGEKGSGNHSVLWNGRDNRGMACSSGIYTAIVKIGSENFSSRMILSK